MTMSRIDDMHAANARALARLPKKYIDDHYGRYAIFKDGCLMSTHSTHREALAAGVQHYPPGAYSVKRIEPQPAQIDATSDATHLTDPPDPRPLTRS